MNAFRNRVAYKKTLVCQRREEGKEAEISLALFILASVFLVQWWNWNKLTKDKMFYKEQIFK